MSRYDIEYVTPNPKIQPACDLDWGELRWWEKGYKQSSAKPINYRIFSDTTQTFGVCFAQPRIRKETKQGVLHQLWKKFIPVREEKPEYYDRRIVKYNSGEPEGLAFILSHPAHSNRFRLTDDALYYPVEVWRDMQQKGTVWVPCAIYRIDDEYGPFVKHYMNFVNSGRLRKETFAEIDDWLKQGDGSGELYLTARYLPVFSKETILKQGTFYENALVAAMAKRFEKFTPPPETDAGIGRWDEVPVPA